jgi:hypothetical protein
MTKIDFSNQFFYLFKGLNWMAQNYWETVLGLPLCLFSEGNQIASIFYKRPWSRLQCRITISSFDDILFFNAIVI